MFFIPLLNNFSHCSMIFFPDLFQEIIADNIYKLVCMNLFMHSKVVGVSDCLKERL